MDAFLRVSKLKSLTGWNLIRVAEVHVDVHYVQIVIYPKGQGHVTDLLRSCIQLCFQDLVISQKVLPFNAIS